MYVTYIKIDGIHCDNCRKKIKEKLLKEKNIKDVEINKNMAKITSSKKLNDEKIICLINSLDYFTKEEYISENIEDINYDCNLKEFMIIFFSLLILIFLIRIIFGYNIFNVIPTIDNNMTYGMLFITGLLTSIHCVSM